MPTYPYALTVVNPNFATDVSGWTTRVGNALVRLTGAGWDGSAGYARTGSSSYNSADQIIEMPSDTWDDIDAGLVQIDASWYQCGFTTLGDVGAAYIMLFDGAGASGNLLGIRGGTLMQPSNYPTWTLRTVSKWLPRGTRSVRYGICSARGDGTNNDTYCDGFSLSLSLRPNPHEQIVLFQGDENTGWTYTTGGPFSVQARGTAWFGNFPALYGNSMAAIVAYREIAIPSRLWADIDAGNATLEYTDYSFDFAGDNDSRRTWVEGRALDGTNLGTIVQNGASRVNYPVYGKPERFTGVIPAGTRKFRYNHDLLRSGASNLDNYVSYMQFQIEAPGATGGGGRRRHGAMMIG